MRNQQWNQSQLNAGNIDTGDEFGGALAAGDFNGDGYQDLAVGASGQTIDDVQDAGAVNIIYGHAGSLSAIHNQFFTVSSPGMNGQLSQNGQFGYALAIGDFNGDHHSDLAIGAPGEVIYFEFAAGAVHVLYGSTARLTTANNQLWTENSTGIDDANVVASPGDSFGASLAVGRLKADGLTDLVIGVPDQYITAFNSFDNSVSSASSAGAVRVLFGTPASAEDPVAGLIATDSQIWDQAIAGIIGDGVDNNEKFGASLAIGDFNGDRLADLAVEVADDTDNGGPGAVNILYSGASGPSVGGGDTGIQENQFWVPKYHQIFFDPAAAAKNLADGNAFLAANRHKAGVISLPDGLEYRVMSSNPSGIQPNDASQVTINYTGTYIDGTVFNTSAQYGGPQTYGVDQVIPGFSEAIKLMHVGDRIRIFIPSDLAYGSQGSGPTVPPNSVLIFDIELLAVS